MDLDELPGLAAYLVAFLVYVLPLLLRLIQRQKQETEREPHPVAATEQAETPPEHPASAQREVSPRTKDDGSLADERQLPETRSSAAPPRSATAPAATPPVDPGSIRQRSVAARQTAVIMRAPIRPRQRSQRTPSQSATTTRSESIDERARSAARRAAEVEQAMQARVPQQPLDSASNAAPIRLLSPQLVVEAVVLNTCLSRRGSDRR